MCSTSDQHWSGSGLHSSLCPISVFFFSLSTGERGAKGEKGDTGIGQRGEIGPPGIPGMFIQKAPQNISLRTVTKTRALQH